MKILAVNGSTRASGSNRRLLITLQKMNPNVEISHLPAQLPLFSAEKDIAPLPQPVIKWRQQLESCNGLIVCTPEYIHGMPAQLKNAFEWVTTSGELMGKKVLAITLTPHSPRGEKAMQSLLWSLQALKANVIASLPLYQNEIVYDGNEIVIGDAHELLTEGLNLFN